MPDTINPTEIADHIEDARLALLQAVDMIADGRSGYSMSNWQISTLATLTTEVERLTRLRRQVVE
ncbi:hypothetical protein [Schaalia sp. ZJ1691]|uniref:hypothetical protein n=1 Tax=Schaalia sp. ZJ1691 TaxID=2709404 RepID=UPI0013E9E545|nr:hypothetical protein [Schaalia sp. ZJ1691]